MLETMQNLESVLGPAARDYPLYAIAPGSAAVVAGLFVWLGGLGLKKILMAIGGAAVGFAAGYFVIGRDVIQAAVLAVVVAAIAVIFERVYFALLTALFVAGFGLIFLVGQHINTEIAQEDIEAWNATNGSDDSSEQLNAYLLEISETLRQVGSEIPVYKWLLVLILTIIALVGGFVFRRLAAAASFSVLGTLLIAAGLVSLLLYKGATPLTWACDRPLMYAGIFAGMAAFGTVEQLLFCRGGFIKPTKKTKTEGDDAGGGKKKKLYRFAD
jgi:hypothetical protein